MKILQINKFFYLRGGSERYMSDLSAILEKNGHEIVYFSMDDTRNWPSKFSGYFAKNVNLDKFSFSALIKFFYNRDAVKKLERLVRKEKPDIAHLHNIAHHLTPHIIKVLKKNNIPVIETLHDYKLICPNYRLFTGGEVCYRCAGGKFANCFKYKCLKDSYAKSFMAMVEAYLNNGLYGGVDMFIAPSRFMKDVSEQFGVPGKKITVVYNFTPAGKHGDLPTKSNEKYLLYFGRLSGEKGIDVLVKAMKDSAMKLKIVGAGPDYQVIESLIKEKDLGGKIEMLGPKYGDDLNALIRGAEGVVIPSVWPENMPMSILEAMAAGVPVIGSRIGGIPEVIKDGVNGYLFEAGDPAGLAEKIVELDRADKQKIKQAAMETAGQFGPEKHYKEIMDIYKKFVK